MEMGEERMDDLCLQAMAVSPVKGHVKGNIFQMGILNLSFCSVGILFETNEGTIGVWRLPKKVLGLVWGWMDHVLVEHGLQDGGVVLVLCAQRLRH